MYYISKSYRVFFFSWPIPAAFKGVSVFPLLLLLRCAGCPHLVHTLSLLQRKRLPRVFKKNDVVEKVFNEASSLTEIDFNTLRL